ncbi:DUF6019 family protein [Lachnospiraceae bacterium 46-15]
MDLWEKFGMSEGIAELWQELGISAGTALVVLIALYFVIKWAVKNGMMEAYKKIEEKRAQGNLKADKTVSDLNTVDEDANGKS